MLFSAAILAAVGVSTWLIAMVIPKRPQPEPAAPPAPGRHAAPVPDARIPSGEPVGVPETVFL